LTLGSLVCLTFCYEQRLTSKYVGITSEIAFFSMLSICDYREEFCGLSRKCTQSYRHLNLLSLFCHGKHFRDKFLSVLGFSLFSAYGKTKGKNYSKNLITRFMILSAKGFRFGVYVFIEPNIYKGFAKKCENSSLENICGFMAEHLTLLSICSGSLPLTERMQFSRKCAKTRTLPAISSSLSSSTDVYSINVVPKLCIKYIFLICQTKQEDRMYAKRNL